VSLRLFSGTQKSIILALIVALNLVGSFALQIIIIRNLGIGMDTDLYIAAQTLPAVWTAIICACIQGVWLHRFSMSSGSPANHRTNYLNAVSQSTLIGVVSSLAFVVTTHFWFDLLFPGLRDADSTVIFQVSALNWGAAALSISFFPCLLMLRVRGIFVTSEFLLLSATAASLLATYFVIEKWGLTGAAAVFFCKALVVSGLYFLLGGIKASDTWSLRANVTQGWRDFINLLGGTSLYKTMPLVDRFFGSLSAAGSITSYNLATSGIGAASALLDRSACAPIITPFGKLVQSGDYTKFKKAYRSSLINLAVLIGLISIALFGAFDPLSDFLEIIFKSPKGTGNQMMTLVLILMGTLYAASTGTILVAAFYALGDTRTPVVIGLLGFAFGLILKIKLFQAWGLHGLAAASSIYLSTNIFVFYIMLEKKVGTRVKHAN